MIAMSKKTFTAMALASLIPISLIMGANASTNAQDVTNFMVGVYSPANGEIYTVSPLTIKLTIAVYASNRVTVFMNYSLDGISNGSIPFGIVPSVFNSPPLVMEWCDGLSELNVSQGIHNLTITTGANSFPLNITVVHFAVNFFEPPVILNLSIQNKTYKTNSLPLEFVSSEPTAWTGYTLDYSPNISIQGNTTLSNLSDGSHSLIVYANDTVGNVGWTNTVFFTVDTSTPSPSPSPTPFPTLTVSPIITPSPSPTQQPTTTPAFTGSNVIADPGVNYTPALIVLSTIIVTVILGVAVYIYFRKRS